MEINMQEPEKKKMYLKSYMSEVLIESSLSALSNIISTESTPRKVFKTLVFLCCLIGFSYQSLTFLGHILEYPTIVDIDIENPDWVDIPAFSFCNNNGISRSKFCENYPGHCIEADEEFCSKYPLICTSNKTMIPKSENYPMINNLTLEDFLDLGQDLENLLIKGSNGPNHTIKGPYIRARNLLGEGRMGCYSLNSLVDSPGKPRQMEKDDFIKLPVAEFKFDVEEDEQFIPSRKSGLLFSIHSPFISGNPSAKGIFMKPGKMYKIYFKMEKEVLLPYPFDTDCINYDKIWLSRNKTGPRMQEMCQHKCGLDVIEKYGNCTLPFILYPNTLKICTMEELRGLFDYEEDLEEEMDNCVLDCKDDCSKVKYTQTVQEGYTADFLWEEDNEKEKKLILVEIYLDDSEIITFRHRPQYLFVEIFSYIGGFIGVWLGISLVELTNFLESLFRILVFSIKRRNAT